MSEKSEQEPPLLPEMRVFTFGEFRVERLVPLLTEPGQPPTYERVSNEMWRSRGSALSLLKVLLCKQRRRASREELIDTLWSEDEQRQMKNAGHAFDAAVSVLRQVLRTHSGASLLSLQTGGDGHLYTLPDRQRLWVDADAFEALVSQAIRADDPLPWWQQAQALVRGEFLEDNRHSEWAQSRRQSLAADQSRMACGLADCYMKVGQSDLADEVLQRHIAINPIDEDALYLVMTLLEQREKYHAAWRLYHRAREENKKEGLPLTPRIHAQAKRIRETLVSPGAKLAYATAHHFSSLSSVKEIPETLTSVLTPDTKTPFEPTSTIAIEELLPQCTATIAACWRLLKGSEILVVQSLLTTYLPGLVKLAQQPSVHQKKLAGLAAQGYILAGLVTVLQLNHEAAEQYCKQALVYSRLAGDRNLEVAALKHLATKFLSAKYPLKTLHTYQEALPLVSQVSPLLRSRIYLGLAIAYAKCGQKQEAHNFLCLAQDTFPEHPEDDSSFSFADCGRSSLNHYSGLIFLEFNQPKKAWAIFAEVEKMKSNIAVPERTVIEIVNCQAEAALVQRDMELACTHVQVGIAGAVKLKSEKRFNDTCSIYNQMRLIWPREQKVKELGELFYR
jgi:DNA-binding SARP family transcriptional activator